MEPIKHPQTARLRSLKMYREDLDEFLEMFRAKCAHVVISDKRCRYESFDEMRKYTGPRIANLEIHGEQPGLHFLLNQSAHEQVYSTPQTIIFNELRADEATEEADALFFRVKDFLSGHQQPRIRKRFVVPAVVVLSGTLLFVTRNQPANHVAPFTPLSMGVMIVGVGVSVVSLILSFTIGNYLTLETKLNSPSFWTKHQDAFAAHAVTATISAVVAGIVGWLAGHFFK